MHPFTILNDEWIRRFEAAGRSLQGRMVGQCFVVHDDRRDFHARATSDAAGAADCELIAGASSRGNAMSTRNPGWL